MLSKRIIACLDVRNGQVVMGVNFEGLRNAGDPDWRLAIPFAAWCLLVGLGVRLRAMRDPSGALGLLRVGAAGMLVLLAWAAPPILARRESGRSPDLT